MADEAFVPPTRDELVRRYCRNYAFRRPEALTGPGTECYFRATQLADFLLPGYHEAVKLAQGKATGTLLEDEAEELGLPRRLPATGSSGYAKIATATGGTTIRRRQELTHEPTGNRYECLATGRYADAAEVPIRALSTGPGTNLPANAILKWTSPPPGLIGACRVVERSDGTGLTGGREEETDEGIQARIDYERANKAAAGNAAQYVAETIKTPGVAVEQAWAYPCIQGPGSIGIVFTVRPSRAGGSRLPTALDIARVRTHIQGKFPEDDVQLFGTLVEEPVDVALRVNWASGSAGWTDAVPWPAYSVAHPVLVSAVTSPLSFTVSTTEAVPTAPTPGRTLALWDAEALVFRQKRILAVTGTNPWTLTVDTAGGASDTSYAPVVGQPVGPWGENLVDLAERVVLHFDSRGPGEQAAAFFDAAGIRERRTPASSGEGYPKDIDSDLASEAKTAEGVGALVQVAPSIPHAPSVGLRGVASYLLVLGNLTVYPLS